MISKKDYGIITNSLKDKQYLQGVGDLFKLPGEIKKITILKDGSLASTYRVEYNTNKSYLFQRMKIQKDVLSESTANVECLLQYLAKQDITIPIHFHHTINKESFVEYDSALWRVKRYFETYKLSQLDSPQTFKELGETIGQFALMTKGFDVNKLNFIITKEHLLKSLMDVCDDEYINSIKDRVLYVEKAYENGVIPLRVVHNDYKIKTITYKGVSRFYINLDLTSPGITLYDFASVVLSYCLDKKDGSQDQASFNIENYKSILTGYLMYAGTALNKEEKRMFAHALLAMAARIALRNKDKSVYGWWKSATKDINDRFDEIAAISDQLVDKIKSKKRYSNVSSIERDSLAYLEKKQYKAGEYMDISMPHLVKRRGSKFYYFMKRFFDIVCSLLAIIVLSPILLIIGILVVTTSRGPMIYVSKRVGKNGRIFNFYKFRSMYKDAEQRLNELLNQNEIEGGITFKMKNDPRITPFGKFIRKTSIDELPQLFNILKGDMSIIGPRAAIPREVELYPEEALDRLMVPQGLSGEWQANGRSDTTFDNMIKMDLDYIQNKSGFWHDVGLIFKTIIVVIKGSGAE